MGATFVQDRERGFKASSNFLLEFATELRIGSSFEDVKSRDGRIVSIWDRVLWVMVGNDRSAGCFQCCLITSSLIKLANELGRGVLL